MRKLVAILALFVLMGVAGCEKPAIIQKNSECKCGPRPRIFGEKPACKCEFCTCEKNSNCGEPECPVKGVDATKIGEDKK